MRVNKTHMEHLLSELKCIWMCMQISHLNRNLYHGRPSKLWRRKGLSFPLPRYSSITSTPTSLLSQATFYFIFFLWLVEVPRPVIQSAHSSGPSRCRDNTRSLTCSTIRELSGYFRSFWVTESESLDFSTCFRTSPFTMHALPFTSTALQMHVSCAPFPWALLVREEL